ncbi:hypothetical protein V6N13_098732 [Hibiscus sabdariffa]|uniref:Uncharacterized protein n=1 Tax=Hibiscus sabdariffa TaxID=183260 RepID=A0ABR2EF61_9ROSI
MAGAADGLFRSIYEGCISDCDFIVERRPYHRNCGCALHDKSSRNCPHGSPKSKNVSYPIKRVWNEGCLALDTAAASPPPSPCFTGFHGTVKPQCKEDDDDKDNYRRKTTQ